MDDTGKHAKVNDEQIRLEFRAVVNLTDEHERLQRLLRIVPDLPLDLLTETLSEVSSLPDENRAWFPECRSPNVSGWWSRH